MEGSKYAQAKTTQRLTNDHLLVFEFSARLIRAKRESMGLCESRIPQRLGRFKQLHFNITTVVKVSPVLQRNVLFLFCSALLTLPFSEVGIKDVIFAKTSSLFRALQAIHLSI